MEFKIEIPFRIIDPFDKSFGCFCSISNFQVTSMVWSGLDDMLLTGHDNGDLVQWDVKTGKKLKMSSDHTKSITDMQLSKDGSMLITSSKDCTSMLFDADDLSPKKKYVTERPVNSASLS